MKLPCSVIHDLLPLYAENMVEPDTKDLVDQHLTECPDCQKRFSEIETSPEPPVGVHGVGDAIQPSHPLSSPFPPTPSPSQHQSIFQ